MGKLMVGRMTIQSLKQGSLFLAIFVILYFPCFAYANQTVLISTVRDFQKSHPDFEKGISGLVKGLVGTTLPPDKKPVFVASPGAGAISNTSTFAQWYNDVPGTNNSITLPLTLTETAPGSGIFDLNVPNFFPIDGILFGNEELSHNYHFTLQLHTTFTYRPGQVFNFTGDDDMWIYINNRLVVDLGGVHDPVSSSVALDTLGLTPGNTYDFDLYFAERHTFSSVFHIQTSIVFNPKLTIRDPGGSNAPVVYSIEKPQGLAPNLIVLVHGCCTGDLNVWNGIRSSIINAILQNPIHGAWETVVWDWRSDPWYLNYVPLLAYINAFPQGRSLGQYITAYPIYKYVHFIAHSAGSNLINNAISYLKARNGSLVTHGTFLDAYSPFSDVSLHPSLPSLGICLRWDSWNMTAVTQKCPACPSLAAAALEA